MPEKDPGGPLKAVVVGCGRMGRHQARLLSRMPEYQLVAVCDIERANAERAAEAVGGTRVYTDFARLLAAEQPAVVAVCASNVAHAALTIQAAEAGVRGVYCEKPMATSLADARRMAEACRVRDIPLLINHQRRLQGDLVEARELLEAGAIGEVRLLRGQCAGDLLSDGTHLVDSLMWLTGDLPAEWVCGQIHRPRPDAADGERGMGFTAQGGYRFGHPVESGAMAVVQLQGGPRLELFCGDMKLDGSAYQDYEVVGSTGRLWRTGDTARPNLFVQDGRRGSWITGIDAGVCKPVPAADGQAGQWRAIEWDDGVGAIEKGLRAVARLVREGGAHPLSGDIALRHFEVLMAIYESARVHQKLALPLDQARFPLEVMLEDGAI